MDTTALLTSLNALCKDIAAKLYLDVLLNAYLRERDGLLACLQSIAPSLITLSSAYIRSEWDILLCGIVAFLVSKLIYVVFFQPKLQNVPSVQGGAPFFGQVFDMIKGSPWDTMTKWVMEYGKIYTFHLFGSDALVIADPELLEVILQSKYHIFKKDLEWTYKPFLVLLGNGLVTSHAKDWRRQRLLMAGHLRNDILEEIPLMALQAVERLSVKLDAVIATGGTIEMAEEFRNLTLQVIAEALLSLDPEESDSTFAHMYLPIVEEGNLRTWNPERGFMPGPAMLSYNLAIKRLNDYVTSIVVKRWALRQEEAKVATNGKEAKDGEEMKRRKYDVLDKMLGAISPSEWNNDWIVQIRDEIKTFVLAGHETSASMLAWTLYELNCAPHDQDRKKQIQNVLRESDKIYTASCVNNKGHVTSMPPRSALTDGQSGLFYTECCLRESLRKYSVVPTVVRLCSQSTQVGPYLIPKGTTIMVNMQGVHHNPEFWPKPLAYIPERHQESYKPFTFIPFVDGARNCLGQHLSLLESKCVLTILLRKYSFELTNPETAGEKHSYMVPIIPKEGHIYKVSKKENNSEGR